MSQRQPHEAEAGLYSGGLPREGVWDGSPRLTAAPNASEAPQGRPIWASVPVNATPDIQLW